MEMIKQDYRYNYTTGADLMIPTEKISCMTKKRSRWYTIGADHTSYNWRQPVEPMLAPTILSTWSK